MNKDIFKTFLEWFGVSFGIYLFLNYVLPDDFKPMSVIMALAYLSGYLISFTDGGINPSQRGIK